MDKNLEIRLEKERKTFKNRFDRLKSKSQMPCFSYLELKITNF